jgi:hypothetical protein
MVAAWVAIKYRGSIWLVHWKILRTYTEYNDMDVTQRHVRLEDSTPQICLEWSLKDRIFHGLVKAQHATRSPKGSTPLAIE